MSRKQSTNSTTNQTTQLTTTPTNPGWVEPGLQQVAGTLTALGQQDPHDFIAGADPLQTQAAGGASALSLSPDYAAASKTLSGIGDTPVQGQSLLDGLQAHMSPYLDNVVNTSLADYDQNAGYTRAGNKLALAGDDTFGGSGGAIQTALSNDQIDRGRASLDAGLRDQGFQVGAGLSNEDAQRRQDAQVSSLQGRLAAAQGLTTNGTAAGAQAIGNVGAQSQIGQMLQALAQAKAGAPLATTAGLTSMWAGLPLQLLHGQTADGTMSGTTTGTDKTSGASLGDWLNYFASNAKAAASGGGG